MNADKAEKTVFFSKLALFCNIASTLSCFFKKKIYLILINCHQIACSTFFTQMKILQIITELGPGGAEKMLTFLADGLSLSGNEVAILSLKSPPQEQYIPRKLEKAKIPVTYLCFDKKPVRAFMQFLRYLKSFQPDIVHSHLMHPNLLARIPCRIMRIPLVNTIHTAEKRKGKSFLFLLDRLTVNMAHITAVSQAVAKHHEKVCHLQDGTIKVISNAIEPVPALSKDECRQKIGSADFSPFTKIIGSVGRLDKLKGFHWLLEHLTNLSQQLPPGEKWLFLIIGDGPERETLKEMSQKIQFPNISVYFAGFRSDAAELMNLFDVFLSVSVCEGFGLAIAEAMSLGLPLVCNRTDAIPELCKAYDNAFLFECEKDPSGEELARCLISAAKKEKCHPYLVAPVKNMILDYESLYAQLLKHPGKHEIRDTRSPGQPDKFDHSTKNPR